MADESTAGISPWERERQRWNTPKRNGGMNCNGFEPYPRMLFKARKRPTGGGFIVIDPFDEQWSAQNCRTVQDEAEERRAIGEGWSLDTEAAKAKAEEEEYGVSRATAERMDAERRMSEKARAEAALVDASTSEHVPEITPEAVAAVKRGPGRPRKDAA